MRISTFSDWLEILPSEPTLLCRRLSKGRMEVHVVVKDINLRLSAKESHVVDLLKEIERLTGGPLPLPSWLTPHFVKPMAGQTSFLGEGGEGLAGPFTEDAGTG